MKSKIEKWPVFDEEQISSVSDVLRSGEVNYWTGNKTRLFEGEFAKYVGTEFAVAVANGTLALHLAYKACGISSGDEIITTPRTFVATASTALIEGAKPVFVDVNINSGNIDPDKIEKRIGPKTKAIVVVHLAGWPARILEIMKIASKHNLYVIEDCSQAHGAKIFHEGLYKSVGSFGDVATWSFCQDKIITTGGEGGMVTTNNKDLWKKIWSYKDHGKSYEKVYQDKKKIGFRWLHENIGSNYRLTEMQSVIGLMQLKYLNDWNRQRNENAKILNKYLSKSKLINIPPLPSDIIHGYYKYYCYLYPDEILKGWSRDRIIKEINTKGYPAYHGGCSEVYLEKCFNQGNAIRLNNAKKMGETSLMFLLHPNISKENMEKYAEAILKIINKATK